MQTMRAKMQRDMCVTLYIGTMNASHNMVWRPPYPSENLKTPRAKTYSTTNPYALHEEPQSQQQQQQSYQVNNFQDFQESQHSKRENNSNKIYERGLTPQVGMNPFLQGNYLQDLETQNEFLKPMNSNISSNKNS
jgi:hypothetical protein